MNKVYAVFYYDLEDSGYYDFGAYKGNFTTDKAEAEAAVVRMSALFPRSYYTVETFKRKKPK